MKKTTAELALAYFSKARTMSQYASLDDLLAADQAERAALIAAIELDIAQAVEPVDCQFQSADGRWHSFLNEQHKDNTIADGTWPIRTLYTAPQESAAPDVNAELLEVLKDVLETLSPNDLEDMPIMVARAREAIAKAGGAA